MAHKIYSSGNYFIIEFNGVAEPKQDSKALVNIWMKDDTTKLYQIESPKLGDQKILLSDMENQDGTPYTQETWETFYRVNSGLITSEQANIGKNELQFDAWGRSKSVKDNSILHGMFTFNVPALVWKEDFNNIERAITNATSVNGKLNLTAGATLNDVTCLRTFRNPRYEPNRGLLYSTSIILPSPTANGTRRFGYFTAESGAFFELRNDGTLWAVVRTTVNTVTTDDANKIIKLPVGLDLSKGNIFDIQMQWRGVGGYKFFVNLQECYHFDYLGTLTELSMFNPANPIAFECKNTGANVIINCGCVDVTSEGGKDNGKTYGSISIDNESGSVAVSGVGQWNVPMIAVHSKLTVGGLINTRDTLMLLSTAYSDQRSFLRVWKTRDFSAITPNNQNWLDYGDGHLEYITYDVPDIVTPMDFDTSKAELVFGSRVNIDESYSTSALFEGRTEIYLTPGDLFVFTLHRETGASFNGGSTLEFGEAI